MGFPPGTSVEFSSSGWWLLEWKAHATSRNSTAWSTHRHRQYACMSTLGWCEQFPLNVQSGIVGIAHLLVHEQGHLNLHQRTFDVSSQSKWNPSPKKKILFDIDLLTFWLAASNNSLRKIKKNCASIWKLLHFTSRGRLLPIPTSEPSPAANVYL